MTEIVRSFYMDEMIARADNWMPMIAGAHPEIVDIDRLWQTTRETPFYVPREAFRIAARESRDHEVAIDLVNRLPENSLVPRTWFKPGFQHLSDDYLYVVTYSGYDSNTGQMKEESVAVYSDESLTLNEVYEDSDEAVATGRYNLEIEGLSVRVSSAYHKVGASW